MVAKHCPEMRLSPFRSGLMPFCMISTGKNLANSYERIYDENEAYDLLLRICTTSILLLSLLVTKVLPLIGSPLPVTSEDTSTTATSYKLLVVVTNLMPLQYLVL